ncbi:hypothetical protein FJZ21_01100 [Candidatus Pacearchaeota archaeon]|nr:hypothetical protein [Candidatus Pacearchaeota archaeon]
MEKRKHVFWELMLIIGSVFVFRSLWILMDRIDLFNSGKSLIIFFFVGVVLTGIGFYKIVHSDKGWGKRH